MKQPKVDPLVRAFIEQLRSIHSQLDVPDDMAQMDEAIDDVMVDIVHFFQTHKIPLHPECEIVNGLESDTLNEGFHEHLGMLTEEMRYNKWGDTVYIRYKKESKQTRKERTDNMMKELAKQPSVLLQKFKKDRNWSGGKITLPTIDVKKDR